MSLIKRNEVNWKPLKFENFLTPDWSGGSTTENKIGFNVPAVNISESGESFFIEVAAPGKNRNDFNIVVDNDVLTVESQAKKADENKEETQFFTRKEFNYNNFKRVFSLAETVDNEKITASYENGILIINLPKKEEAKIPAKRMIKVS